MNVVTSSKRRAWAWLSSFSCHGLFFRSVAWDGEKKSISWRNMGAKWHFELQRIWKGESRIFGHPSKPKCLFQAEATVTICCICISVVYFLFLVYRQPTVVPVKECCFTCSVSWESEERGLPPWPANCFFWAGGQEWCSSSFSGMVGAGEAQLIWGWEPHGTIQHTKQILVWLCC